SKSARASESRQRPPSEFGQVLPSPRRQEPRYPAKSEICARPTRSCSFLAGNNDRSPYKHKVSAMISKVKSQGKRTVELTVVGRALRLATQGVPFTSTPA